MKICGSQYHYWKEVKSIFLGFARLSVRDKTLFRPTTHPKKGPSITNTRKFMCTHHSGECLRWVNGKMYSFLINIFRLVRENLDVLTSNQFIRKMSERFFRLLEECDLPFLSCGEASQNHPRGINLLNFMLLQKEHSVSPSLQRVFIGDICTS